MEPFGPFLKRFLQRRVGVVIHRGFSLVEMLVVLAIIAIVTTISLVGQSSFNGSIFLTDTAYSVALSLREMQTLGLSSRKYGGVQDAGYGAYFAANAPSSYVLYADTYSAGSIATNCLVGVVNTPERKPGDCLYTSGQDGIVQTYSFSRGFTVSQFCGKESGVTAPRCSGDGYLSAINIVFMRSTTDSIVLGLHNSTWVPLTSASLYLRSADGAGTRAICVSQVGQVSVVNGTCP